MNLDDFSTVVDEQRYINPQVALDESDAFIQNLRDVQQSHNAGIAQDTYNLGTAVPSNIGGLGGSGSYFNARYQTPQTNTLIADLKATAQAQALSDAMNNAVSQAKQRYNKAYKNYAKRHGGSGITSPTTTEPSGTNPDVEFTSPGDELTLRYKGSEGTLNSGWTGNSKVREYYFLGSNGQRTPVNIVGSGSSITIDSPNMSYSGKDAANRYIQSMIGKGNKLMARNDSGQVRDITGGYHVNLGI